MKLLPLFALLPGIAFSATMTNKIVTVGMGPQGFSTPWLCVQDANGKVGLKLAQGQSGDANKASGNPYYAGASLRLDGCDYSNSYLGYLGFSIGSPGNNAISSYQPPEGVHVTYASRAINSQGVVTGEVKYTPIQTNLNMTQAKSAKNWQFAGINLSGLEFGKVIDPSVIPNLSQEDASTQFTDLADTNAFIMAGMNTVRIPISWGYIQPEGAGKGSLNLSYYQNFIQPTLRSLTHAKVHTIIDLHAYMRYSKYGEQYSGCGPTGNCPDGTLILDQAAYNSVWGQIATLIQEDPQINKEYIMLDLMNEPVGVPDNKVFTIQTGLIKLLREKLFTGYILVEGNNWTGLHSWDTATWNGADGQVYSNATLFTRENFEKEGINDLSKILINVHQYLDNDYSGTHNDCLQDLSTQGPQGFNLQSFVDYLQTNQLKAIVTEFGVGTDAASCSAPLNQFMQYLQENSATDKNYGFAGWTVWSTGHGWGGYNLRVKPDSYAMQILRDFL